MINGIDISQSIFILLSNTGGREITKKTFEAWEQGQRREDLRYADYENLIRLGAFNEVGGLKKSALIDRSVVDIYVPFLPLEKRHLKQCAIKELKVRGYEGSDYHEIVSQIIADMSFWPEDSQVYSTTGCKRVAQKVDELLYENSL